LSRTSWPRGAVVRRRLERLFEQVGAVHCAGCSGVASVSLSCWVSVRFSGRLRKHQRVCLEDGLIASRRSCAPPRRARPSTALFTLATSVEAVKHVDGLPGKLGQSTRCTASTCRSPRTAISRRDFARRLEESAEAPPLFRSQTDPQRRRSPWSIGRRPWVLWPHTAISSTPMALTALEIRGGEAPVDHPRTRREPAPSWVSEYLGNLAPRRAVVPKRGLNSLKGCRLRCLPSAGEKLDGTPHLGNRYACEVTKSNQKPHNGTNLERAAARVPAYRRPTAHAFRSKSPATPFRARMFTVNAVVTGG